MQRAAGGDGRHRRSARAALGAALLAGLACRGGAPDPVPPPVAGEGAPAGAGDYHDETTGLTFPLRLGDYDRTAVRSFGHEELGYGVSYRGATGGVVMVYVYDLGLDHVEDGVGSERVRDEFARAKRDVQVTETAAEGGAATHRGDDSVHLGSATDGWPALRAVFDVRRGERTLASALFVTGCLDHFVKVRATCPAASTPCRDQAADFLDAIGARLRAGGAAGGEGEPLDLPEPPGPSALPPGTTVAAGTFPAARAPLRA